MILLKRYFKLFLKIDYTFLLSLCYNCVLFLFVFNDVKEHFFQASTEAANGNDVEAKEQSSRARALVIVSVALGIILFMSDLEVRKQYIK